MILQRIVELVAPASCLRCGTEGAALCEACRAAPEFRASPKCFRCLRPALNGRTCAECRELTALAGVAVAAHYDGAVKELILELKFHRLQSAAGAAAGLVGGALPAAEFDLVTAVPVSAGRYRERGYNQSRLIAVRVAGQLGVPYRELLGREGSAHQLGVDRRTRLQQVAGAFYSLRALAGERILIVDDVITTGATLSECAGVLRAGGGGEIWGAVVARH